MRIVGADLGAGRARELAEAVVIDEDGGRCAGAAPAMVIDLARIADFPVSKLGELLPWK